MTEAQVLSLYFSTIVFVFGACIGSFLNVVIYRLPAGKSVVTPRSQCSCGEPIAWYDNIPIFSWFILRGRCRHCRQSFSIRYPLVELGTACLFLGFWHQATPAVSIAWMIFGGLMIPAALIDLDTMEIPDRFSVGGFLLGVVVSGFVPMIHGLEPSGYLILDAMRGGVYALLGAFVGSGLVLWVALTAELVLRKEAMGFGDVKLMGAIGAFCGWQGAIFAFFGGAVLGMLALVVCYPFMRKRTEEGTGMRIPFGPALVGGAILYLLGLAPYVNEYFANVQEVFAAF